VADQTKYNVLIIGGGTAGITVASSLAKRQGSRKLSIAVVEPQNDHYYQPALTLVGAGAYSLDKTRRQEGKLVPSGVQWINSKATAFDPDNNGITLDSGETLGYD
jgi:sulfide:quinone oxidoreductase